MASHLFRRLTALKSIPRANLLNNVPSMSYSKIYEPDYLEALKPKYPLYPPLVVRIRSHDFPILESYQSWIHKVAEAMDFDMEDSYPMPARETKVTRYKHKSTVVDAQYLLRMYERDLMISNVPSIRLPIFIRVLEAALPEGVILDIEEYSQEKENYRYIPDKQLLDLKQELEDIQKSKDNKSKK
ncbi:probable 28S ribosomal protein S10, mitochondrial [Nasonia vitripennis]|uniref:Small ribosomal subunit protein uS10 domain-containing protein n=1 Tax=Nasonia vitripennis TaxID=7425 RepID=A0A7M7G8Y3_NASVI|nr:probable 28S ribosomal protein S10, mitochondrial [Nasonia vitripennis]